MIVGKEAVEKMESLPERHKGVYVSEAIADKVQRDSANFIIPNTSHDSKETFEEYLRRIIREEINRTTV
jgi:hypothetical protein